MDLVDTLIFFWKDSAVTADYAHGLLVKRREAEARRHAKRVRQNVKRALWEVKNAAALGFESIAYLATEETANEVVEELRSRGLRVERELPTVRINIGGWGN